MAWRPLVTDPEERARILEVVREIATSITDAVEPGDVSLHCDRAVLRAYLAADGTLPDDDDATTRHVAAALAAARETSMLALHGGVADVGWTIAHLADDDHAQEILATLDVALLSLLERWTGPYDLIGGIVGIGVYALERAEAGLALAARVIELLHHTAQQRGAGTAWHTPAAHLPNWQRELAPDGYYNLGVAHGIAGIIAFCARCVAAGIEASKANALMTGAIDYLLDAAPPNGDGRFPSWITPAGIAWGDRTRPAWCYGDLGVAAALSVAAKLDEVWVDHARAIAVSCAEREPHPSIRSAPICHGAAGMTHVLNRFYQSTNDPTFGAAALRWLKLTLELRNGHAYAGFPEFDGATDAWRANARLLSGATGVALVLHSVASDVEPSWDRKLLLDLVT